MKKILVADNEVSTRLLYDEELKEEGCEICLSAERAEALEVIKFPWIWSSWTLKLPEMDGIEALEDGLRKASRQGRDLPVSPEHRLRRVQTGFCHLGLIDEYLVKSSDLKDLKAVVKRYLKSNPENEAPMSKLKWCCYYPGRGAGGLCRGKRPAGAGVQILQISVGRTAPVSGGLSQPGGGSSDRLGRPRLRGSGDRRQAQAAQPASAQQQQQESH